MLDKEFLKKSLQADFHHTIVNGLSDAFAQTFNNPENELIKETSYEFAENVVKSVINPLCEQLANEVDNYIKSMQIVGQIGINKIQTIGSPTAQQQLAPVVIDVQTLAETPYDVQIPVDLTNIVTSGTGVGTCTLKIT